MNTLFRHEQDIIREEDGAVEFCRLKRDLKAKIPHSVRWSHNTWVNHLQRGGGKRRDSSSAKSHWISNSLHPGIHGHSGETTVDPSLFNNVLIPKDFFQFIYHIGSYFNMHSIIASGLIAEKFMDEIDKRYSLQSLIPSIKIGSIKKKNLICLNRDTPGFSMCGTSHKMQFIGLTLVALGEWD